MRSGILQSATPSDPKTRVGLDFFSYGSGPTHSALFPIGNSLPPAPDRLVARLPDRLIELIGRHEWIQEAVAAKEVDLLFLQMKKNRILSIGILCALSGCMAKDKFKDIKAGMDGQQVIRLVGAPADRRLLINTEWWLYKDPERHLIIMRAGLVSKCLTQDSAAKIMENTLKTIDSLGHK